MKQLKTFLLVGFFLCCVAGMMGQSTNINFYGGLEGGLPSYWTMGNQPSGSTLTWATDQYRSMGHSLKIDKPLVSSDSASWISQNMCDIWSPQHLANVDILLGAYVMTQNVNMNPVSDDEKWWISYSFWDSAGTFIGETKLPIDQSVATSGGWFADTNGIGETNLPRNSWTTIVKFVAGKNATGTVWADDFVFYGRGGAWAGQDWNTGVDVPTGWYYWLPPNGGNDGLLADGFENTVLTTEASHSGLYSLKFDLPFDRVQHDGFVGTKRFWMKNISTDIHPGDKLRVKVWVKADNLVPDSAALYPLTWSVGVSPLFDKGVGNNFGYNPTGPDLQFAFPPVTSFDWTQYWADVNVPSDPSYTSMEVRLHVYSRFTGTVYFDDMTVEKLDVQDLNEIGGLEGGLPSYWTIGNQPSGSTVSWATDQFRSLGHSLKIDKPNVTSDSASWISQNMCDIWSPQHLANVDILLGGYVRTLNVNTNPASDDEKWWISYSFWDSAGAFIGETKLPIDQSVATSSGWFADTNGIGETNLPKNSWTTIVKFVAGKNATGTVWADDFVFYGRGGAWAGQDWNTGVGVPTGWYYWLPPNGGNDGLLADGFENTVVTSEASHSGTYSLKFDMPFDRVQHDGFVATKRFLFNGSGPAPAALQKLKGLSMLSDVSPGDRLRIKVWVKASNLVPDSAALYPATWAVGVTPLFDKGNGNNFGYNPTGPDLQFAFPAVTSFDWTQYWADVTVPSDPSYDVMEVRLHVYSRFTGTVYFDDVTVEKLNTPDLNEIGGLEDPLPSYWTVGSQPSGSTVSWATDEFQSMGHSLKIDKPNVTGDSASWISQNMCDIWSPQHLANVDILLGAYVKTANVNTNPASDDEKWWISYSFWDSAGAFIGETKLPIDQSVATSSGWFADTNGIGETNLPKNSWTTIVKFVAGKNATGTVWAGNFVFYGRGGAWAGQDWNTGVGVPTGWYYWLPPNGGNDGLLADGFENTVLTNEAAHTGNYSLKFDLPFDRVQHDGFVATKRFLMNGTGIGTLSQLSSVRSRQGTTVVSRVNPGDILRATVWVKASSLVPDSAALYPTTWSVGLTPLFDKGNANNLGYNPTGPDLQFVFPPVTAFDWTPYSVDFTVPSDSSYKALEVRLHVYSRFTGTVYFDDLTVDKVGTTTGVSNKNQLPKTWALADNYPNPFNPTTTIGFDVPRVADASIVIYNLLGQEVRTLITGTLSPGQHTVVWDGRNNHGMNVQSGVYFYRLNAGSVSIVKKMLLLK